MLRKLRLRQKNGFLTKKKRVEEAKHAALRSLRSFQFYSIFIGICTPYSEDFRRSKNGY